MKKSVITGLVLAGVLVAAVAAYSIAVEPTKTDTVEPGKAAADAKDYVVLEVNGDKIMKSDVNLIWNSAFPQGQAPEFDSFDERIRQQLLRGLVSERLVYKEALAAGADKQEDVKKKVEAVKRQLVMQAYLEDKTDELVTDDKLKAAYDEFLKTEGNKEEIHARHILVKSEDEARKIAKEVKDGADFAALAKQKSEDKASGDQGGDLGYFTEDKMVPEFGKAAFAMKKGEISEPVKSEFGWHIIKVEDRRKIKAPSFEEMKEALAKQVREKAVDEYANSLVEKAEVKYYDASGKEKEFPKTLPNMAPAAGQ